MKGTVVISLIIALLAWASSIASAYDPNPLQDFCVGVNDTKLGAFVNGELCKDPKLVTTEDFFYLITPGNTSNPLGSKVTQVFVNQLPALNTLGLALARIDFAPSGLNPPHYHPRASELLTVIEGTLLAGFVASNQNDNRLFTKVLNKGDVFLAPLGMIHFQLNIGHGDAVAHASFSSQNPGVVTVANTVFGSTPPISADILSKAFQVDKDIIANLQKQQQ